MSYTILANKWRPKDFSQVVGQDIVVKILKNSLASKKLHHAYLFTGTRGVGKTTLARIFAKSLVCEQGISVEPCDKCELCLAVNESRCLDVVEIDAASRTKVEDTRLILDNLAYAPNQARFKIYIIDEVHMLSHHSFNALLKSLEEPPLHIKFLLATTDPNKLPITVLSRTLQFKLKEFMPNDIVVQLDKILLAEHKAAEIAALHLLAKFANGSMRDALSLLEQLLVFKENNNTITYEDVIAVLHLPAERALVDLLNAVISSDVTAGLKIIHSFFRENCDPGLILQDLQAMLKNLSILKLSSNADLTAGEMAQDNLLNLAARISNEDLQLYYEIVLNCYKNLAFVPDLKVAMEMMILRMISFQPINLSQSQKIQPNKIQASKSVLELTSHNFDNALNNPAGDSSGQNDAIIDYDFMPVIAKLELPAGLAKELVQNSVFGWINQTQIKMIIDQAKKLIATKINIENIQNAFSKILGKKIKLMVVYQDFTIDQTLLHRTSKYIDNKLKQNYIDQDKNLKGMLQDFDGEVIT